MQCDRCRVEMEADEAREYAGQTICDDCYMDVLSPTKSCDPWAIYTATRLGDQELNQAQQAIMDCIAKQGQATAKELMAVAGLELKALEREMAALRHLELLGAKQTPDGGKVFVSFKNRA